MPSGIGVLYWQLKYRNRHYVNGIIFPDGELLLIKFKMKQDSFVYTQSTPPHTYLMAAFLEKNHCVLK